MVMNKEPAGGGFAPTPLRISHPEYVPDRVNSQQVTVARQLHMMTLHEPVIR